MVPDVGFIKTSFIYSNIYKIYTVTVTAVFTKKYS